MKLGLIQMTSTELWEHNIEFIDKELSVLVKKGVRHVFLPEVFFSMSNGEEGPRHLVAFGSEYFAIIQKLAQKHGVFLLGGTVAFKNEEGEVVNRSLNFNPQGDLLGFYDKRKLFSCDYKTRDGKHILLNEGKHYKAGEKEKIIDLGDFRLGLTVCFDLRFPELFRSYGRQGVELISVSSAFTQATGKVHWEALLRARAIENQCYIVACNQVGKHNERVTSWGHSMVIDPWGEILLNAESELGAFNCEIDLDRIKAVKGRMNVF